ncbi:hypothetical protein XENOCAPTIV_009743 [Xenoophorus captivus]|uniref:Uncharacterized protein n=1 Tax=Xenoophorus captivus TaxID=1517983 RepID=A0ABV0R0G6_9TELE
MECNTPHTQCTIGLAHTPCQELTGWTELCQSHYDNEYNTYAHEVVWKKIGRVWRRSLGGGSTCAKTVLGHNLRDRKSIMDVIVPFIPDSVIALAELYAFRQHLCSGNIDKGLDWVGYNLFYSNLTCYAKRIFGHFWIRRWEVVLSLFASYLMGRVSIDWRRSLMVALWLCVDTIALVLEILLSGPHATRWGVLSLLYWLQLTSDLAIMVWLMTYAPLLHYSAASPDASYLCVTPEAYWCHHCLSIAVDYATVTSVFCIEGPGDLPYISMTMSQTVQTRYKVTWTSAFGAAAHTFRIKTQQGGMYLLIISYIWEDPKDRFWLPTLHLLNGRVVAVGTHSSPDSPPPGTDVKGCQVSVTTAEGSTQSTVTTKTVTCQTSAGDDEEQHQPASPGELVSQTSATGDSMREETGPPQLSDGLLAEVMSAIPPQPLSPPLPLLPILSPLHSPVTPSHMEGSGSPLLMGLPHHLSSRGSLCHLPFRCILTSSTSLRFSTSGPRCKSLDHHITQNSWKRSSPCVFMIQTLIFSDFWDFRHGYSLISRRGCQNKV